MTATTIDPGTYTAHIGDVVTYRDGGREVTATVQGTLTSGSDTYVLLYFGEREGGRNLAAQDQWPWPYRIADYRDPAGTYSAAITDDSVIWFGPTRNIVAVDPATDTLTVPTTTTSDHDVARDMLRVIGEALADTADRSEWCGEYENLLRDLIRALPANDLRDTFEQAATRSRTYTLCVHLSYSGTSTVTVEVDGSSLDDAIETFNDDPSAFIESDDVARNRDGSEDWEVDEVHSA